MSVLKIFYRKIRAFIRNQKERYIPYRKIISVWLKNKNQPYKMISLDEAKRYKKSDTIFILGSGPSIKDLTQEQWKHIDKHDSFGINFSHLLDYVPTYYSLEDGHTKWFRRFVEEKLRPYRKKFSSSVWCISDRHIGRFIHPRLAPAFFPENPLCYFYKFPPTLEFKEDRPFRKEDFAKSIIYRGSLSTVLYLIDKIGYKNIVLLGIDLHTPEHFFYNMKEMEEYVKMQKDIHDKDKFQYMILKKNKVKPFDEYLCALDKLYFAPKGVNLYMGGRDKVIYPRLKIYKW
ncbi:MAG: hypothetical protein KAS99_00450 [Candidatus Omnitrophica bacterium]|nr:hypothetical protein [Candidatus Omnitrophota bacterium]